ncbi:unnamed protein product [Adineta steineri]|uniref:EGF-like domain-containing protein n=1 Tax=Adineta steineri TaxID=433720 RepID=A0A815IAD4_9BILA|nr:unnamed protein product [Adineta steineri]
MFSKLISIYIIGYYLFQSSVYGYPSNDDANVKQCSKSDCSNNGVCLLMNNIRQCYCYPEWQGEKCNLIREFKKDSNKQVKQISRITSRNTPCSYVPDLCKNSGVCYLGDDKKLACQCPYPYDGARCQEYSVCYNYCFNNGICEVEGDEPKDKKPKCECGDNFDGERCQVPITTTMGSTTTTTTTTVSTTPDIICSYLPDGYCNDGSCIVINNLAKCQCPPTHTGDQCQISTGVTQSPGQIILPTQNPFQTQYPFQTNPPINPGITNSPQVGITCTRNPCRNNRPCYNNGNSYYCFCGSAYSGVNCEINAG